MASDIDDRSLNRVKSLLMSASQWYIYPEPDVPVPEKDGFYDSLKNTFGLGRSGLRQSESVGSYLLSLIGDDGSELYATDWLLIVKNDGFMHFFYVDNPSNYNNLGDEFVSSHKDDVILKYDGFEPYRDEDSISDEIKEYKKVEKLRPFGLINNSTVSRK